MLPKTFLILLSTIFSIIVLASPKYPRGSNLSGFKAKNFLIAAVIANLKSVSMFILQTDKLDASRKISFGTPFAPDNFPPYSLQMETQF